MSRDRWSIDGLGLQLAAGGGRPFEWARALDQASIRLMELYIDPRDTANSSLITPIAPRM